jgi:hypothetical protein
MNKYKGRFLKNEKRSMSQTIMVQNNFVDAVNVCPHIYQVLLENEIVRVLEMRERPGEKDQMHSSRKRVTYAIQYARLRIFLPDLPSHDSEISAGKAFFQEATPMHSVQNIGTSDAHFLIVELKS